MSTTPRFWRNLTLIALAHVALIAGLIRWSVAARSAPDAESLVWLSGAEDLAAERSEGRAAAPNEITVPSAEPETSEPDQKAQEQTPLKQEKNKKKNTK